MEIFLAVVLGAVFLCGLFSLVVGGTSWLGAEGGRRVQLPLLDGFNDCPYSGRSCLLLSGLTCQHRSHRLGRVGLATPVEIVSVWDSLIRRNR